MCHLRHRLRIFLFHRKVATFSRYPSFCVSNHPMIHQICDIMMIISTWDRVYFWICLLNHNSLRHQTWPVDRYKQGQYFSGIFWTIWRTGTKFQVLFNLAACSNYFITNYITIPVFHFFEKVNNGHFKMLNVSF